VLGLLEKNNILPVSIAGVPTKPVIAVLAHLVAGSTSGTMHRVLSAAGDSTLAVYAHQAARIGGLIAGDEDVELL
jgi:hypothetical protein